MTTNTSTATVDGLQAGVTYTGEIQAMVEHIRSEVLTAMDAELQARIENGLPKLDAFATETRAVDVIGNELLAIATQRLHNNQPGLTTRNETDITNRVLAAVVGLGPVQLILADPTVEEIIASRWDLVFVYRSDGSVELLDYKLWNSETELLDWLALKARTAGRTERAFNSQSPLLVMRLGEGLRLAAHRDVSQHVGFALRRNTMGKVTLEDLLNKQTMAPELGEMLAAVMRSTEMRVVFAGPTGAGKSTMARACLAELSAEKHVIIIEDTAELDCFDERQHPNVESWEERQPNTEGEGAITMGQLVRHGLRARPDWLVAGEVRDSDASVPMIKAMTHGQSSLTTVHAADASAALDKLAMYLGTGEDKLDMAVAHHQLSLAVDFVIHLDRLPDGSRVVTEVIEVEGFDGTRCTTNQLYVNDMISGPVASTKMTDRRRMKLARAGFDARALLNIGGIR